MKVKEYWHGTIKNYRYDGDVSAFKKFRYDVDVSNITLCLWISLFVPCGTNPCRY